MSAAELRLGSTIDTEGIAASYEDGVLTLTLPVGVLTLTLPVSERAKPRQVQVGRGGSTHIEGGESR